MTVEVIQCTERHIELYWLWMLLQLTLLLLLLLLLLMLVMVVVMVKLLMLLLLLPFNGNYCGLRLEKRPVSMKHALTISQCENTIRF